MICLYGNVQTTSIQANDNLEAASLISWRQGWMRPLSLFVLPELEERVPFVVHIAQDLLERADQESDKYRVSSISDAAQLLSSEVELKAEAEGEAGLEGLGDKDTKYDVYYVPLHPSWSANQVLCECQRRIREMSVGADEIALCATD